MNHLAHQILLGPEWRSDSGWCLLCGALICSSWMGFLRALCSAHCICIWNYTLGKILQGTHPAPPAEPFVPSNFKRRKGKQVPFPLGLPVHNSNRIQNGIFFFNHNDHFLMIMKRSEIMTRWNSSVIRPAVSCGCPGHRAPQPPATSPCPTSEEAVRTEAFSEVALIFFKLFEAEKHYK